MASLGMKQLSTDVPIATGSVQGQADPFMQILRDAQSKNPELSATALIEKHPELKEQLLAQLTGGLPTKSSSPDTTSISSGKPIPNELIAQATPNPQPGPGPNYFVDLNARFINQYRAQINDAGRHFKVAPEVIGTIIFDEMQHRGGKDVQQDKLAQAIINTRVGTAERAAAINDANNDWAVRPPFQSGDISKSTTLGPAQMSVAGVRALVSKGYLDGLIDKATFNADPIGQSMALLLDPKAAPYLVGAWAAKVMDLESGHRSASGFTYANFRQGDAAHFVFLTGTYSEGGNFHNRDLFGNIKSDQLDAAKNKDPMSFVNSQGSGPNQSAEDALRYRAVINNALR